MTSPVTSGRGGTFQARVERNALADISAARLSMLELGDQSLCFGRIDVAATATDPAERWYIGRLSVSDEDNEPVVVDWRAPAAEPFYRATGREPMGLARRRHFASQGRVLRGIDDEFFGETAATLERGSVVGQGALIAALESSRSGKLGDIVATIQAEQDEVIRAPLPGVLVVQGGPGTGKTVVALHRAAYLLYTHRFPLEGQGVLVIGPNRLFLSYIEQVLPSLGEAGVEIAMLADLVPGIRAAGVDEPRVGALKADLRMCRLLAHAVRDRQRPLRDTAAIPWGVEWLRITPEESTELVAHARRRSRSHNAGRRHFETAFFELLASKMRHPLDPEALRDRIRLLPETREALERMWPRLSAPELLNDLFGSMPLLRLASRGDFSEDELRLLHRPRAAHPDEIVWHLDDVPLVDEALELLGPRSKKEAEHQAIRTYGHIVVDEAQDLSPMELRVVDRRSLNGSITIVGDVAQSTSPGGHDDWDAVLERLPQKRPPRTAELLVGYRVPAPSMRFAARVLPLAAPGLAAPSSIRETGDEPVVTGTSDAGFDEALADAVRREVIAAGSGNVAVVAALDWVERCEDALTGQGVDFGRAQKGHLDHQVTVAPVRLVKGLEVDSCIVVEPSAILDGEHRGAQNLYVALTRATKRLTVLHVAPLPAVLTTEPTPGSSSPT